MLNNLKIFVVIPSYKVKKHIIDVVENIPGFVDSIVVIDDACPQQSGHYVMEQTDINNLHVLFHEVNKGCGGAVISGCRYALTNGADIVVKVDGDGQMDPNQIEKLVSPIISGVAGYTKGNRFKDHHKLRDMPKIRLFGNSILSFMMKVCSGYWNIMDPTNGFTAISKRSLELLNLDDLYERYYYDPGMLVKLNIENVVVQDVDIPARYKDEESSLTISRILGEYPVLMFKSIIERIFLKYYLYDFNMASIYILIGLPLLMFGSIFGIIMWINGAIDNEYNSVGTIMISVLSITLGIQFLLQAINIDIASTPKNS
jgi:dolichol-phosphate mannosyltransferase